MLDVENFTAIINPGESAILAVSSTLKNAARPGLRAIVVVGLVVATIAALVWEPWKFEAFSFAPWLAVLLLFVLADVFARGARMRDDLAGTV